MKNDILILSYYSPFENAPRPAQLLGILNLLNNENCNIDLITTKQPGDYCKHFRYDLYNLKNITIQEIDYESTFSRIVNKFFTTFLSIEKNISFSVLAFFKVIINIKKYNRIICITNPFTVAFIGYLLKKLKIGKILHIDAGDPFVNHRRYIGKPFKKIRVFIERLVCNNVDIFVLPVKDTLKDFKYLKKNAHIIEQIFPAKKMTSNYILDYNTINIFYAGRLYEKYREPYALFDALESLYNQGYKIYFHYFGPDSLSKKIKSYLDNLSISNVTTINSNIDREYLLDIMEKMDILINILNTGLNQIPSKIIEYRMSESFILNIGDFKFINNNKLIGDYCLNDKTDIENKLKFIIKNNLYKNPIFYDLNESRYKEYLKLFNND